MYQTEETECAHSIAADMTGFALLCMSSGRSQCAFAGCSLFGGLPAVLRTVGMLVNRGARCLEMRNEIFLRIEEPEEKCGANM